MIYHNGSWSLTRGPIRNWNWGWSLSSQRRCLNGR